MAASPLLTFGHSIAGREQLTALLHCADSATGSAPPQSAESCARAVSRRRTGVTIVGGRSCVPKPRRWKGSVPRSYAPEFRKKVLDLIEADRPVKQVAEMLGISDQTIYNWRRHP
jgi:hypothetical protein